MCGLLEGQPIDKWRSRSRQTSDLNSGEFSYIRQLFLRQPLLEGQAIDGETQSRRAPGVEAQGE